MVREIKKNTWIVLLLGVFLFRFAFGITSTFWADDELQIYLLGLKFYTTNLWPYWGPDVVYNQSQIPGALQALFIGLPLKLVAWPEAPYVLLNILSFSTLLFFAWYVTKRVVGVPKWFVYLWILTCPWAMHFSTHVINPSYVLPFAILFFIGVFEGLPIYTIKVLPRWIGFVAIGLSTACVMQLHMSWVLMLPFTGVVFLYALKQNGFKQSIVDGLLYVGGFAIGALTLVPTLLLETKGAGVAGNIVFNSDNVTQIVNVVVRFLSFASFEVGYMIGANTKERVAFLQNYMWAAPFTIVLLVVGFAQVIYLVRLFFKRGNREWQTIKWMTLASIILVWISFFFSAKGPSSHTFYMMFPLAMLFAMYGYQFLLAWKTKWVLYLKLLLLFGFIFHIALLLDNTHKRSLYTNRDKVLKAIEQKDYKLVAPRRADAWGYGY